MSDASCEREELLSAYLDGELRSGELALVELHLSTCGTCIAAFRDLKSARSAVRLLPEVDPPFGLLPAGHMGSALSAYLDGELPTAEVGEISRHLAVCTECRRDLQELDAARTAVRALPRLEPPPLVAVRRSSLRSPRWRAVAVATVGAAAVAALTIGIDRTDPAPPVDLDSLATRHVARVSVDAGFSVTPTPIPLGSR